MTEPLLAFLKTCKQFLYLDEECPEVGKTREQLVVDRVTYVRFENPGFDSPLSCP